MLILLPSGACIASEICSPIAPLAGSGTGRSPGADNLEMLAASLGLLGADFSVTEPPELVAAVRTLAARYAAAASPAGS